MKNLKTSSILTIIFAIIFICSCKEESSPSTPDTTTAEYLKYNFTLNAKSYSLQSDSIVYEYIGAGATGAISLSGYSFNKTDATTTSILILGDWDKKIGSYNMGAFILLTDNRTLETNTFKTLPSGLNLKVNSVDNNFLEASFEGKFTKEGGIDTFNLSNSRLRIKMKS